MAEPWNLLTGQMVRSADGTHWTVEGRIGRGGTAVVFGVRDQWGRAGAAKLLSGHRFELTAAMHQRFAREITRLAEIVHPCVLRVLDHAVVEDQDVLITERLSGTVYDRVVGKPPVAIAAGLGWLAQATSGVQALHDAGLVHRDLSLKNLLLRDDGSLVVGDFGTVRHVDDVTLTLGENLGSLLYISPQQYRDAHRAGAADDIYALGQIAWHVFTGFAPQGNVPPIVRERPDAPEEISSLVVQMREYEPGSRPSAGAVLTTVVRHLRPALRCHVSSDPDQAATVTAAVLRQLTRRSQRLYEEMVRLLPVDLEDEVGIDSVAAARRQIESEVIEVHQALSICRLAAHPDRTPGPSDVYCEYCPYQGGDYPSEGAMPLCPNCGRDALQVVRQYPADAACWGSAPVFTLSYVAGPTGGLTPMVPFRLSAGLKHELTDAGVVDANSDPTVLPVAFLQRLGLSRSDCRVLDVFLAGRSETAYMPVQPLTLDVLGRSITSTPMFMDIPVSVLGRKDLLSRFEVSFDERRQLMRLKPSS